MQPLTRRSFMRQSLAAAAAVLLGDRWGAAVAGGPVPRPAAAGTHAIAAATGRDYFASTKAAVARLGGIEAFVPRGASVGLLVNSPFKNFGASVNPDITLAVVDLCRKAGCGEIRYLKDPHAGYWQRAGRHAQFENQIRELQFVDGDHVRVDVKGGRVLETVKVVRALEDCDVFINVAIAKHHKGVEYTGLLKNMMGLCPFSTNSYFHWGTLKLGWYADLEHLTQCIADLNLVRRPTLCILDATEFITANGPWGPGPIRKHGVVLAGSDPVAMDAYGCTLLDLQPADVLAIPKAAAHGLGHLGPGGPQINAITL